MMTPKLLLDINMITHKLFEGLHVFYSLRADQFVVPVQSRLLGSLKYSLQQFFFSYLLYIYNVKFV